jgi:hypothetical protein
MKAFLDSTMYAKSQVLLSHAKRLADATDRVFVSLAEGVGRIGPWPGRRSSPPPRIAALKPQDATRHSSPLLDSMERGRTGARRTARTQDGGVASRDDTLEPAGVVPVLEALARVMDSHATGSYSAVAADNRFWALIGLLQSLASGDSSLELASACHADSGYDIHVEEDLSHLGPVGASCDPRDNETHQRERAG